MGSGAESAMALVNIVHQQAAVPCGHGSQMVLRHVIEIYRNHLTSHSVGPECRYVRQRLCTLGDAP